MPLPVGTALTPKPGTAQIRVTSAPAKVRDTTQRDRTGNP